MNDPISSTIAERGKVYGPPAHSHTNIGLSWTGLLQQHYQITLDHPLPNYLVDLMMVALKAQRSAMAYKEDNYTDLHAYARFAQEDQAPFQPPPELPHNPDCRCIKCWPQPDKDSLDAFEEGLKNPPPAEPDEPAASKAKERRHHSEVCRCIMCWPKEVLGQPVQILQKKPYQRGFPCQRDCNCELCQWERANPKSV